MFQRKRNSSTRLMSRRSDGEKEDNRKSNSGREQHPIAQLQKLQQTVGNRAVVQMMRPLVQRQTVSRRNSDEKEEHGSEAHGSKQGSSSGRPLPDSLRSRVEQLSGFDLSEVEVHYDSEEPGQVGALAYAQGDDIHLAPGEERHLPHEAWHVVQQKQGQVRPTMQLQGVMVNDDPALELEADMMAQRAMMMQEEERPERNMYNHEVHDNENAPIQRVTSAQRHSQDPPNSYSEYKEAVEDIVMRIVDEVEKARTYAIHWHYLSGEESAHLTLWYAIAQQYVQNLDTEPKLLHARFGYAIEDIACRAIPAQFGGLSIQFQVSSGHTRPDIVIYANGKDIAWIDITSKNSAGHIMDKSGSGWKSRPYVYEILYDPLDLQELIRSSHNEYYNEYGNFVAQEQQIVYEEMEEARKYFGYFYEDVADSFKWQSGTGNQKFKQEISRDLVLAEAGIEDIPRNKILTKGALSYFGLNPRIYGFKPSDKQDNRLGVNMVKDRAEPAINKRKEILLYETYDRLLQFFLQYHDLQVVNEFFATHDGQAPNREIVDNAMLLKATILNLVKLNELAQQIPPDSEYQMFINLYIQIFPQHYDLEMLSEWHKMTVEHIQDIHRELDNMEDMNYIAQEQV